jgi:hypothetical protein
MTTPQTQGLVERLERVANFARLLPVEPPGKALSYSWPGMKRQDRYELAASDVAAVVAVARQALSPEEGG